MIYELEYTNLEYDQHTDATVIIEVFATDVPMSSAAYWNSDGQPDYRTITMLLTGDGTENLKPVTLTPDKLNTLWPHLENEIIADLNEAIVQNGGIQ